MKVNIMSDLHLEFGGSLTVPKSDVLILAGDIGIANKPDTYVPFLEEVSSKTEHIIMIMGNHEHYHGSFEKSRSRIIKATEHIDNFRFFDNNAYIVDDVAFIGSTLWSNIEPTVIPYIMRNMNDYSAINYENRTLIPNDTIKAFYKSRDFIFRTIQLYKKLGYKVFVITHHSPSTRTAKEYRGNLLNSAYGSALEDQILIHEPDYWVFGHTHVSSKFEIGKTKLICNPRGYYPNDLNEDFNVDEVVNV